MPTRSSFFKILFEKVKAPEWNESQVMKKKVSVDRFKEVRKALHFVKLILHDRKLESKTGCKGGKEFIQR